jgi:CheY-like chemotaxis protein
MGMQPFAELLMRPNAAPAMIGKSASHIANSIQRGKRVTLDILRFTQPAQPVLTSFDLGAFWQTFAPEAEGVVGNMIHMVSRIPFRGLPVIADKSQLAQVLLNLVTNARDAMSGGGTLTIQAGIPEEHALFPFGYVPNAERFVHISITDSGSGMPPDVLEHAFDPLFTTKRGGTGLGLAVAHQVLTQHGGHIFAESEPGRSTAFHLFLQRGTSEERKLEEVTSAHEARGRRILIIEDEALIVEGLSMLLSSLGFEVQTTRFGAQAADLFGTFQPDIVLLDLGLPDMDGTEVYSRIRKLDESVPVIFATGHGDRRAIQNDIMDSRIRFLQKPFEISALTSAIADVTHAEG